MAEVVQTDTGQPRFANDVLEGMGDGAGIPRSAMGMSKNKLLLCQGLSKHCPLRFLLRSVLA